RNWGFDLDHRVRAVRDHDAVEFDPDTSGGGLEDDRQHQMRSLQAFATRPGILAGRSPACLPSIAGAPCSNISLRSHTELAVEFTHQRPAAHHLDFGPGSDDGEIGCWLGAA